jgi:ribosomal protein S18 acetylase RimI-like enzyme
MTAPVRLRDKTDAEYEAYMAEMVPKYASEGGRATNMSAEAAMEFAQRQLSKILFDGRHTPGQHLSMVEDADGVVVGRVWYASQHHREPTRIFLYDIVVDPAQRGRGLGAAVLLALEEEARRLGVEVVGLHVFTHNEGAIRLYERLGYVVEMAGDGGQSMRKAVSS